MHDLAQLDDLQLPAQNISIPAELIQATQTALAETTAGVDEIHTHSNTSFQTRHFVLNHDGAARNFRQVCAQLQRRKDALQEAQTNLRKKIATIQYKREQADEIDSIEPAKAHLLRAHADADADQLPMMRRAVIGAMREVTELAQLYQQLYSQIEARHGRVDETTLEAEEAEYWVKRLIRQSLRDIRAHGAINTGNQEALECIGLDPAQVQRMCIEWLGETHDSQDIGGVKIASFLDACAKQFAAAPTAHDTRRHLFTDHAHLQRQDTP